MGKLTSGQVEHVARLANLVLTKSEVKLYQKQLSTIIDYIESLSEVAVSHLSPTSQTTGLVNVTREDGVDSTRILGVNNALSEAPEAHNGYFMVPPVIIKKHDDR